MLDLSKYENADRNVLMNAFNSIEKKHRKLLEQVQESEELLRYLTKQLKKTLKVQKSTKKKNVPTDETLQALKNDESIGVFDTFNEAKKALMS